MTQSYSDNLGEPIERTLTVTNYGTDDDEEQIIKTRITISRDMVEFIISSEGPVSAVDGLDLYKVNLLTGSGKNMELFITFLDLQMIERAVGVYFLP